jgi:hypothetical protein
MPRDHINSELNLADFNLGGSGHDMRIIYLAFQCTDGWFLERT